jgi:hypothetical protein
MEPEGSFRALNISQLDPVVNQMDTVHILPRYYFEICFNIITQSVPYPPSDGHCIAAFPTKIERACHDIHAYCMLRPSYLSSFNYPDTR